MKPRRRPAVRAWRPELVTTRAAVALIAVALALSGCLTSSSPPVGDTASSHSFAVVRSNVDKGNLNLALSGLSCSARSDCWATGEDTVLEGQSIPTNGTLLMHYVGGAWRQVLHAGTSQGSNPPQLGQLSCPLAGWCMATVGYTEQVAGVQYPTFGIIANGRLELLRTATISASSAVACKSATFCVGVGSTPDGSFAAEAWNGSTWKTMPASWIHGVATAVSCPTARYCMAVGATDGRTGFMPGAMQWNGSTWRATPRPTGKFGADTCRSGPCSMLPVRPPRFTAVSCASPRFCMALGSGYGSFGFLWDGTSWAELSKLYDVGVSAVSCATPRFCLAVGGTMVVSIVGNTVSRVGQPAPFAPARTNLNAVDCPAANSCVVLGSLQFASTQGEQLAESWNGRTWESEPFQPPRFTLVKPDSLSEELGPCASDPGSNVVTVSLVPHRGFAAVTPTCQLVELGQLLNVRNATSGSVTTSIGTTFVFTLKPGETAQLRPALSVLLARGHHSLGFTGSNFGTGADLWIGSRSQQPGYQLTISSDSPRSACASVKGGKVVAAYVARSEQLSRSFAWSRALDVEQPGAKMTLCVVVHSNHVRSLSVLNEAGSIVLTTGAPASVLVQQF